MKKAIALSLCLACVGLSGVASAVPSKGDKTEKAAKAPAAQAEKKAEAGNPLDRMDLVEMPDSVVPGKVTSVFSLAGGDALVVKGSWVILSKEGEGMIQLAPFDDPSGKRARMLVVSSDKMDSDVEFGARLLKTFREKTCKDKEELTAETIPDKAVLVKTSSGAAFFSACPVEEKGLFYVVDSIKGKGSMRHGILYGVDEERPDSAKAAADLGNKAIREYQSMFLEVVADPTKGK